MMTMSELKAACEKLGVVATFRHIGFREAKYFPDSKDEWFCTLTFEGRSDTFEYHTGIGHRNIPYGWKVDGRKYIGPYGKVFSQQEAIYQNILTVTTPSISDILECLFSDDASGTETFDDWCRSMGMNHDSLKALNTYIKCQRNGTNLRYVLGHKVFTELSVIATENPS